MNAISRDDCDVAVVGAGPYGLSLAAHLSAANITARVFGEPMAFWRRNMPIGMKLRSPWEATHIVDPADRFSLDVFAAATQRARREPLPLEDFVCYGLWFQQHAVPDLDARKVTLIEPRENAFCLHLEDGHRVYARRVVIAMGLANQDYRPPQFAGLPSELVSHTSAHADLSHFRGQRVAVIGRGQSACESAALLKEAEAEPEIICRGEIHWLGATPSGRNYKHGLYWHAHRMLASRSGVGPFPLNFLNEAPGFVHRLPPALRATLNRLSLRAGAAGWLQPRLSGVRIDAGRTILSARARGAQVIVETDRGARAFDHVLLATGYQIDVRKFGVLGSDLIKQVACNDGAPMLAHGYESSVPGLHFIGASAVASYGPLLRFVWGAGFAARAVTRHILARRSGAAMRGRSGGEPVTASRRNKRASPLPRSPSSLRSDALGSP